MRLKLCFFKAYYAGQCISANTLEFLLPGITLNHGVKHQNARAITVVFIWLDNVIEGK